MPVTLVKIRYSVVNHSPGCLPESDPYVTYDFTDALAVFRAELESIDIECDGTCDGRAEPCLNCLEHAHIGAFLADMDTDRRYATVHASLLRLSAGGHRHAADPIVAYYTDYSNADLPYRRYAIEASTA